MIFSEYSAIVPAIRAKARQEGRKFIGWTRWGSVRIIKRGDPIDGVVRPRSCSVPVSGFTAT